MPFLPLVVDNITNYVLRAMCKNIDQISFEEEIKSLLEEKRALGNLNSHQIAISVYEHMVEKYSDKGYGCCWLDRPEIIEIVKAELHSYDKIKYRLYAYAIMPNHVHILLKSMDTPLFQIVKDIKGRTARKCNLLLQRQGQFWARDYFDRATRNGEHFYHVLRYVLKNPANAGSRGVAWKARYGCSPWISKEFTTQNDLEISKFSRGYIPHWETSDTCQFVTIRLFDSVPNHLIEKWKRIIDCLSSL